MSIFPPLPIYFQLCHSDILCKGDIFALLLFGTNVDKNIFTPLRHNLFFCQRKDSPTVETN